MGSSSTWRNRTTRTFFVSCILVAATFLVLMGRNQGNLRTAPEIMLKKAEAEVAESIDTTGKSEYKFLDQFKSQSRLAPLVSNKPFLKDSGFFDTYKGKYQLLDSREVSKKYSPPTAAKSSSKSPQYLYSVLYSEDTCSGTIFAISGAMVGVCVAMDPVESPTGHTDGSVYKSYLLDCDSGDVIANMYASDD